MNAAPDRYIGPAFIGWRSWRVMPFERLGEPPSVRLCASGTRGLPKVWEPRSAMHAVCGKFDTTHSSPWPDCECGFYAYRRQDDAADHLQTFVKGKNGDGALGWAFGRVSLWGRIVECVYGWRAEYAYPYEITVHSDDPKVAAALRSLYGIDVQPAPALRAAICRPATTIPPRTLWTTLRSAMDGGLRTNAQEDDFVYSELWDAESAHRRPVTAGELAESIMRRAGVDDGYQANGGDASSIGQILARLTLSRHGYVSRAKTPESSATHWTRSIGVVPDDYTEYDPTERFLARDVAMVLALGRAGEGAPASATAMLVELSTAMGEPQAAKNWSETFVRCRQRGWIMSVGDRTYQLTDLGDAIVDLGRPPTPWPSSSDAAAAQTLLRELQEAVRHASDAVTVHDVNRRFTHPIWDRPGGHALAQRLRKLQEQGLVASERRTTSALLYWRPATACKGLQEGAAA